MSQESRPFRLAVKALVTNDQGRILLVRRSEKSKFFGGSWDLPGGKVDPGESFDEALRREVAEETGLEISLEGVAGATEYPMPTVRIATLFLEARRVSGEVQLSEEHDAYTWVWRDELDTMELSDQLRSFLLSYARRQRDA